MLVDRAQAVGALRPDFVPEDLPMLLMANAGVVAATADATPRTSPRLVEYLLQAFSARAKPTRCPSPRHPGRCTAPSAACIHPHARGSPQVPRRPVGRLPSGLGLNHPLIGIRSASMRPQSAE